MDGHVLYQIWLIFAYVVFGALISLPWKRSHIRYRFRHVLSRWSVQLTKDEDAMCLDLGEGSDCHIVNACDGRLPMMDPSWVTWNLGTQELIPSLHEELIAWWFFARGKDLYEYVTRFVLATCPSSRWWWRRHRGWVFAASKIEGMVFQFERIALDSFCMFSNLVGQKDKSDETWFCGGSMDTLVLLSWCSQKINLLYAMNRKTIQNLQSILHIEVDYVRWT